MRNLFSPPAAFGISWLSESLRGAFQPSSFAPINEVHCYAEPGWY